MKDWPGITKRQSGFCCQRWLECECNDKCDCSILISPESQSRTPPILPLSVALSSFPQPRPTPSIPPETLVLEPTLNHVLSLILPSVVHLALSIPFLNESTFLPKSVEEDLHSGVLQLPKGTAVLVSDGTVSEGTLNNGAKRGALSIAIRVCSISQFLAGVLNVRALKQCISSQTIAYSFPFNDFSFSTDLNFLVLTQDKKSPFVDVSGLPDAMYRNILMCNPRRPT